MLRQLRKENERLSREVATHRQAAQSESGVEDLKESVGEDAIESQMRIRTLELELQSERDEHERRVAEVRNECEDLRKERDRTA